MNSLSEKSDQLLKYISRMFSIPVFDRPFAHELLQSMNEWRVNRQELDIILSKTSIPIFFYRKGFECLLNIFNTKQNNLS